MKIAKFVTVIASGLLIGADPKGDETAKPFQGKWEIVEATERGVAADPERIKKFPVIFSGDQMEMIYEGKNTIKWTVTFRPDKSPKGIDAALPKEIEKGKIVRGIYQFEEDFLQIALGLDAESTRPQNFESVKGGKPTLVMLLKKAK